jgi:hypothetical protein
MISSEVERTLVKSPPELWTELSNPDALARHLGEFGEIRITRVEPEHEVAWEAGDTAGTVRIKPSGWGTKVTLTATREIAAPEQLVSVAAVPEPVPVPEPVRAAVLEPAAALEPATEPEVEVEAGPPTPAPEPDPAPDSIESRPAPEPVATKRVVAAEPAPQPRLGFFRRLFGGARARNATREPREAAPTPVLPDPFSAVREALAPETVAAVDPFSMPRPAEPMPAVASAIAEPAEQPAGISADLRASEEVAAEEVTAVLTSVLDRLGAAHHRPFSRA